MPHDITRLVRRVVLATAGIAIACSAFAEEPAPVEIGDITLKVPASWESEEPSNRLRLAQFVIPSAEGVEEPTELVISFFGGGGGGIDANITRWIGQFSNEGRQVKVTKGTSDQGTYYLADLKGTYNKSIGPPFLRKTQAMPGSQMIAVILQVEGKGNYFLKLVGPAESVAPQIDKLRTAFGGDAESEREYELN
ncbi:hypothetical protein [Calycomorphotria hydatis]|uniref:PsbP C-terminal domain-containing protein n=1 Tax=Calycomorphotria hydatis TaxID=2528027 RepID=A0A517T817_9PLAN|nr:hypothetical protein [Calycomorphotria hydatis]QDT64507.1 hypothetical protein V22_17420 [Calycomorphotria hydatis]